MSWLLSPSSATKMIPKLSNRACIGFLRVLPGGEAVTPSTGHRLTMPGRRSCSPTEVDPGTGAHRSACRSPGVGATPLHHVASYRVRVAMAPLGRPRLASRAELGAGVGPHQRQIA